MADGRAEWKTGGGATAGGRAAGGPARGLPGGSSDPDPAAIARRLSPPPSLDALPLDIAAFDRGDHMMNPDRAIFATGPLKPAAVLVPLVTHPGAMHVLLTHRAQTLARHAGQIAFPGGRVDPEDGDLVACALRETEEEVGLPRTGIEVLGALDPYLTATGYVVAPIVGLVAPGFDLRLEAREVASSFEVPLRFLMDEANHRKDSGHFQGRERHWWAIPYGEHYIWGATAGMLRNLRDRLAG